MIDTILIGLVAVISLVGVLFHTLVEWEPYFKDDNSDDNIDDDNRSLDKKDDLY